MVGRRRESSQGFALLRAVLSSTTQASSVKGETLWIFVKFSSWGKVNKISIEYP